MSWNRSVKYGLFAIFGIIIGSLGTFVYMKGHLSGLPRFPNGTSSFVLTIATAVLAMATIQLKNSTKKYAKTAENMLESNIKHTEIANDMLNEQRMIIKKDCLLKEMELLVAPLNSKKEDGDFFLKGIPANRDANTQKGIRFFEFWDGIKIYKYTSPKYLQSAINKYLENVSLVVNAAPDEAHTKAKDELYEAIKQRYDELNNELSMLE